MSVLYAFNTDVLGIVGSALACMECGDPLSSPIVYWHGASLLLFHPACAAALGPHLIADAREAALAADPEPRWRRRSIATVRRRLERAGAVA